MISYKKVIALTVTTLSLALTVISAIAADTYLADPTTYYRSSEYYPFSFPANPSMDDRCEDMHTTNGLKYISCSNGLGCIETNNPTEYQQSCPFWRTCSAGDKSPMALCQEECLDTGDSDYCDGFCAGKIELCRYQGSCLGANASCKDKIECASSVCDGLSIDPADNSVITPGRCLPITRCQPDCVTVGKQKFTYSCCIGLVPDAAGICQAEQLPIFPDATFEDIDYFSYRVDSEKNIVKRYPTEGGVEHKVDPFTCSATLHVKKGGVYQEDTNYVRRTATSMERSYHSIEWLWGMATIYLNDYFSVNKQAKNAGVFLKDQRAQIHEWYGEKLSELTKEGEKLMDNKGDTGTPSGTDATSGTQEEGKKYARYTEEFGPLIDKLSSGETDSTSAVETYRHLAKKNRLLAERDMRHEGLMQGFIANLDGITSILNSSSGQLNNWSGSSIWCIILPFLCPPRQNICGGSGTGSPNKTCTRSCVTTSLGSVVDPLWDGLDSSEAGMIKRFTTYANHILTNYPETIGDYPRVTLTTSPIELEIDLAMPKELAKATTYEARRTMALDVAGKMAYTWFTMFGRGGCGQVQHSQKMETVRRMKEQAIFLQKYYKRSFEMRMATADCLDNFANTMSGIYKVSNHKQDATSLRRIVLGGEKIEDGKVDQAEAPPSVAPQFECPPNTPGCSGTAPGATKALPGNTIKDLTANSSSTDLPSGKELDSSGDSQKPKALAKNRQLKKGGELRAAYDLQGSGQRKNRNSENQRGNQGKNIKIGSSAAFSAGGTQDQQAIANNRNYQQDKYQELTEQRAGGSDDQDEGREGFGRFSLTPSSFSSQDDPDDQSSEHSNSKKSYRQEEKDGESEEESPAERERRRYIALMLRDIANNKHRYTSSKIDGLFWKISKTYIRYAIPRFYQPDNLLEVEESGTGSSGKAPSQKGKKKSKK